MEISSPRNFHWKQDNEEVTTGMQSSKNSCPLHLEPSGTHIIRPVISPYYDNILLSNT